MSTSRRRRLGVYFGLLEETEEERLRREGEDGAPRSARAVAAIAVLAGAISGAVWGPIAGDSVEESIGFGVLMGVVFLATGLVERRKALRRGPSS